MRTAIISDIHANLDALKVVLDDLRAQERGPRGVPWRCRGIRPRTQRVRAAR